MPKFHVKVAMPTGAKKVTVQADTMANAIEVARTAVLDAIDTVTHSQAAFDDSESHNLGPVATDRLRHRDWMTLMTKRGLGGLPLPEAANAALAFGVGTLHEGQGLAEGVVDAAKQGSLDPLVEAFKEGYQDTKSNVQGLKLALTSKDEAEAFSRALAQVKLNYDPTK